jgi:putative Mg2+ transporter-C (MgtC) family protein
MDPLKILGLSEIVLRLGSAVLLGALLGLNRELRGKPAGLRTNALVALTSALVVIGGVGIAASGDPPTNPAVISHTMQGVITGIGFLGAGVIIREPTGTRIHGVTTAATIWLAAAIGILCGAGIWSVALVGSALTFVVMVVGRPLEKYLHRKFPNLAEHDNDHHEPTEKK